MRIAMTQRNHPPASAAMRQRQRKPSRATANGMHRETRDHGSSTCGACYDRIRHSSETFRKSANRVRNAHSGVTVCALDSPSLTRHSGMNAIAGPIVVYHRSQLENRRLNAERHDPRAGHRIPLREHVSHSVRRYLGDLNGSDSHNLYEVALRELEIPLFAEVLKHCDGNQSRAAAMLGIHRGTLRKKLKDYGLA
jgi:Fis family transcriptional regulator, factor for inversion stimulation protein